VIQHEQEYNDLLDALLPFGQQMLDRYGEFFPYAAVVGGDGVVTLVGGDIGDDRPNPTALLEFLFQALRKQVQENACRAAGLCVNVTVVDPRSGQKGDALRFVFEHSAGEAAEIYFPYRKRFLRGHQFEKPFAQKSEPRIFGS
jgi:hypothetical protein